MRDQLVEDVVAVAQQEQHRGELVRGLLEVLARHVDQLFLLRVVLQRGESAGRRLTSFLMKALMLSRMSSVFSRLL